VIGFGHGLAQTRLFVRVSSQICESKLLPLVLGLALTLVDQAAEIVSRGSNGKETPMSNPKTVLITAGYLICFRVIRMIVADAEEWQKMADVIGAIGLGIINAAAAFGLDSENSVILKGSGSRSLLRSRRISPKSPRRFYAFTKKCHGNQ
jgi:hypothetical protein